MFEFKAAILEKQNTALKIKKISFNDCLKEGQILIKLKYSGICGKQIDEIKGIAGKDQFLPHLLGHEGSGVVIKTGPKVKKVKKKDRVILHWVISTGIQSETPKYFFKNKKINAGCVTTFNEYAVVSENRVTKIPNKYPFKKACLFGCVATTALGLVYNELNLKKNDALLVVGAGGLGQIIIQAAKTFNLKKIIALDLNEVALKKAKRLGANIILNIKKQASLKMLKNLGFNKSVVTTGDIKALQIAINLTPIAGACYIMGVPKKNGILKLNAWKLMHDQVIKGCLGGNTFPERDIPKFISFDKKKIINLNQIIFKTIKFKELNTGLKLFSSPKTTGRILIKF